MPLRQNRPPGHHGRSGAIYGELVQGLRQSSPSGLSLHLCPRCLFALGNMASRDGMSLVRRTRKTMRNAGR
ncbi:hypothetical protein I7I53_01410 [Histoplasma capsulatum var. duboisii H88]|uniref:Uncharacterized protein n=2 Tax=Ajellomyces capsulatus TaxID=5037 RepID=A0A8H7YQQ6_AJECA|nr:hypothetical protein I7I52_05409 [Histoplasma capsulatum]QSS53982.1 hypothetical protein I7I53_01410 [Histoplasma capsulatum var. duboisii H88]QSS75376.1 hypothetical protein I7I50_04500 [Histoplasma capsulatum G186AR]